MEKILPILTILLNFSAGIVYACNGDIRHSVYWFSAGLITISVTF